VFGVCHKRNQNIRLKNANLHTRFDITFFNGLNITTHIQANWFIHFESFFNFFKFAYAI
jgi:hypothetical protein